MIFVSYSKDDIIYRNKIELEFEALKNQIGFNSYWIDNQIDSGENWQESILKAKEQATIAILLVSKKFLASRFIKDNELDYFLKKGIKIYWFLIQDCTWSNTDLNELQAVTIDGERLTSFKEYEQTSQSFKIDKILSEKCQEMFEIITKQFTHQPKKRNSNIFTCNRQSQFDQFYLFYQVLGQKNNSFIISLLGKQCDYVKKFINKVVYELKFKESNYLNMELYLKSISEKQKKRIIRDLGLQFWQTTSDLHEIPAIKVGDLTLKELEFKNDNETPFILFVNIIIQSTRFSNKKVDYILEWIENISKKHNNNIKTIFLLSYELNEDISKNIIDDIKKYRKNNIKGFVEQFNEEEIPKTYNKLIPLPIEQFGNITKDDALDWCNIVIKDEILKNKIENNFNNEKTMQEFENFIKKLNK